jgi:hypothetical protein
LDASDSATILKSDGTACAPGDGVQTWKDKSGNGKDSTNQYGYKPVLEANVINGKSVLRFTATSQLMGTQLKDNMELVQVLFPFLVCTHAEICAEFGDMITCV